MAEYFKISDGSQTEFIRIDKENKRLPGISLLYLGENPKAIMTHNTGRNLNYYKRANILPYPVDAKEIDPFEFLQKFSKAKQFFSFQN